MTRRRNLSPGQFLDQQGRAHQRVGRHVGIDPALEAERGIGAQPVALGRLADPDRIEIGAFDKDVGRRLRDARIEPAEHAGYAHRLAGVADHQVVGRKFALDPVQRRERGSFGAGPHDDAAALDFRRVERVQGLSRFVQNEVGDVDHVVFRIHSDRAQPSLEPFGRGSHLHAGYRDAHVSRRGFGILHFDGYFFPVAVLCEGFHRRKLQLAGQAVGFQINGQIARYAVVRHRVGTVRRQADLEQVVVFQLEIVAGQAYRPARPAAAR